jgi:MFS family permease
MPFRSRRRPFAALVAALTASSLAEGALLPFLVIWAHRDAGLHGSAAGLLFVALAGGELAGGLVGGMLGDRIGAHRVLLVANAGMALGYGALTLAGDPVAAVAITLAAGLFESAFHPTAFALIGELVPSDELHAAYGRARVGMNAGRIAGPLIGALVALVALRLVFCAAGLLLVLGLVCLLAGLPRQLRGELEDDDDDDAAVAGLRAIARNRRLGLLVLAGGLLAITFTWFEADGLVLLRGQRTLSATVFALLFTFAAALTVALQMAVVRWARGRSVRRMLALGALAQAVGLALLAGASAGIAVLVIAVAVIALAQMLYGPAVTAFVAEHAPRGARATYQAAMSTTVDIGTALGPTSGLALAALAGSRVVWLAALPLGLVAAVASTRATAGPLAQPAAEARAR